MDTFPSFYLIQSVCLFSFVLVFLAGPFGKVRAALDLGNFGCGSGLSALDLRSGIKLAEPGFVVSVFSVIFFP